MFFGATVGASATCDQTMYYDNSIKLTTSINLINTFDCKIK